ncbi:MAG: nucleoside recognition domain-containing protein, partial [Negativicoccus succinicivorans]|nr:nucleoside recognition domain-containing protein [Negativicoccus succinicivorans]
MSEARTVKVKRKGFIELFTEGAYNGLMIGIRNMLPNVMLAFILIHALKITGLLDWIGSIAGPIMSLWLLPGVAITVIMASLLSMGGAIGIMAALLAAGAISPYEA